MPWKVQRDEQVCSAAEPWALKNSDTDELVACHATEDDAERQRRALEANVNEDRAEVRSVELTDVAISEDGLRFSGYAAVFDKVADLGDFTEEVRRGAFRKILSQSANVPMYWDHDPTIPPLATTRGGTLRLAEDATGLRVEADLDNDHYMTPTLRSMIRRGDVAGMSFGFIAGKGNQSMELRDGRPHRVLTGFRMLLDVSPTWNPAYEGTSVEMRSALAEIRKARLDSEQQVADGEHQQAGDGASDEGAENAQQDPAADAVEKRDSGVSEVDAELAARRRRLKLMGLSLSKDDKAWLADDKPVEPEQRTVAVPDLKEVLRYPAATWSPEERKCVLEQLFAITSEDGKLTAEQAERFAALQDEFERLGQ